MIYLDNAASAFVSEAICDDFKKHATSLYANQEAGHGFAYKTRNALQEAEASIAVTLTGSKANQVFWFGSGTEAISQTVKFPEFLKGNVVTTEIEHPAIAAAVKRWPNEARFCSITENGKIDYSSLRSCLDEDTSLVVCHLVQGEVGILQDLPFLRAIINELAPRAALFVDSVQAVGKVRIPWDEAGIDGLFFSGHKIGVPGGAGVVLRAEKNKCLCNYIEALRKESYQVGRVDPAIALTCAAQITALSKDYQDYIAKIQDLNQALRKELSAMILPNGKRVILLTSSRVETSPFIISFLVPGYQAAVLVRMLSAKNIFISAGSACQAETNTPNKTLTALGYNKDLAYSGLRCSLWLQNDMEDIKGFIESFKVVLKDY